MSQQRHWQDFLAPSYLFCELAGFNLMSITLLAPGVVTSFVWKGSSPNLASNKRIYKN